MVEEFKNHIGLGIAGNFANHLAQAGEARDFAGIESESENAPKGIFPFYVPDSKNFLVRYCVDNECVLLPNDDASNLESQNVATKNLASYNTSVQAEAEVALECEIGYDENHLVNKIVPKFFMAFNDASVRNDKNATKLSQKKNFSLGSKGYGEPKILIDTFSENGICQNYSIVSFITSDGVCEPYGELSALSSYSYFYENLIRWIIKTLNTQQEVAVLENLREILKKANYPTKALIAVGATRYVDKNECRMLRKGDVVHTIVFNHNKYSEQEIEQIAKHDLQASALRGEISILRQVVQV